MEITGPIVLGDAHLQDGTRSTWGHMKEFRIYSTAFSDSLIQAATAGSVNSIGSTPNAPASVTIGTTSTSSITLSWATPTSDGGATISDYLIQYKIGAGAYTTWTHTATSATSTTITGLTSTTGYTFSISAINEIGTGTAAIGFGTTTTPIDTTAPAISSIASSTTQTTASITWSTDESASSSIQYGLTTGYGTVASSSATSSHSVSLSGLTAGTLYNFKVTAIDASGNVGSSTNYIFTTAALPVTPPTVTAQSATSVSTSSATLNGTITNNNNASSTVRGFEYGLTTSYGSTASTTGTFNTGSYTQAIAGLTASTTYYYRAFATNSAGTGTSTSGTFTTDAGPDVTAPVFNTFAASVTNSSATISWNTDENSSSQLTFGLSSAYSSTTSVTDTSPRVSAHIITLNSLTSCTKYFYRAISTDSNANTATSSEQSFITSGCTSNAGVEQVAIQGITSASGGSTILSSGSLSALLVFPSNVTSTSSSFIVQAKIIDDTVVVAQTSSPVISGLSVVPNHIYDFKAYTGLGTTLTTFALPVTITLNYSTSDIAGLIESTLRIYTYDGTAWSMLSNCSVDTVAKQVTCTTDHFSVFGLFATPSPVALSAAPQNSVTYGGTIDPRYITSSTVSTPATPSTPSKSDSKKGVLTKELKLGATHAEVKTVQQILNNLGISIATKGTGSLGKEITYFGAGTKAAVIKFQKKYGIPTTGIVGPTTRAKLMKFAK